MTIDQDDALQDDARKAASDAGEPGDACPACGAGSSVPEDEHVEPRYGVSESEHRREIDDLRAEVEKESARAAELRDQLVRTAADFDNFRKRTERDRVEERKQASASLVRSLLPVLDGLGRALATATPLAAANAELASFSDGARMIEAQLKDVLKQAGLEPIEAGGLFDPAHHEALMQEATIDAPHMTILDVFEPGYRLGGRLLRPARVKVAYNPAGEAGEAAGGGRGGGEPGTGEDSSTDGDGTAGVL